MGSSSKLEECRSPKPEGAGSIPVSPAILFFGAEPNRGLPNPTKTATSTTAQEPSWSAPHETLHAAAGSQG